MYWYVRSSADIECDWDNLKKLRSVKLRTLFWSMYTYLHSIMGDIPFPYIPRN